MESSHEIVQGQVLGEPGTGYENENGKGDFECGNCRYFDAASSTCGQKTMVAMSRQPKMPDGRVKVEEEGCCEYVDRVGGDMAKLSYGERKELPAGDFAGPDRSYPINDPGHARNALARVSQFGSPALKAKVRAKVHKKYPSIGGKIKKELGGK